MSVDPNAPTQGGFPVPPRAGGPPRAHPARYLVPALVAAAVAVGLGAYGKVHDPEGTAFNLAGFSSTGAVKSWLATTALGFAVLQVVSALMVHLVVFLKEDQGFSVTGATVIVSIMTAVTMAAALAAFRRGVARFGAFGG